LFLARQTCRYLQVFPQPSPTADKPPQVSPLAWKFPALPAVNQCSGRVPVGHETDYANSADVMMGGLRKGADVLLSPPLVEVGTSVPEFLTACIRSSITDDQPTQVPLSPRAGLPCAALRGSQNGTRHRRAAMQLK
jgi:hypothetical protein